MIRWLDYPPIWLAGFIAAVWGMARMFPGFRIEFLWQGSVALVLLLVGLVLMGLAVWEMGKARTTVIPHRQPNALVRSGVFRISRNPIYLGDALVLGAAITWTGAFLALPLIWVFKRVIEARFILPEEARLEAGFGDGFVDWSKATRRWV